MINGKPILNSGNVSNVSNAVISFELACYAATTANLNATYSNGTAGVGATLTNAGALAAFSVDGVSPSANARILVKDQSTQAQNGIYILTTVGSGSVAWVLTRASDYDTSSEINSGDIIPISSGSSNTGSLWRQTATVTTIGTDAITFAAFFLPSNYVLKSGDTMTGALTAPSFTSTGAANTVKEYSANSGSAITIDPANGETQYITLNAATPTITFASAPAAGTSKKIKLTLVQDGTGGRQPTFANCTFLATGSSTPTAINQAIAATTYFEADAVNGAWIVSAANQNLGVTDGSSAASGYIGEIISSTIAIGSAVSLTTATAKSITSITLTPGDWMVSGNIGFIAASGTLPTILTASISQVDNTQATSPNGGGFNQLQLAFAATSTNVLSMAPTRINISAQTTVYLVGTATFTVSTLTAYGSITARRFR